MPSFEHSALVELLRGRPELVPELLQRSLGVAVPAYRTLTVSDATLDELRPVEYRADLVVELQGEAATPLLAAIVEVQLRVDRAKELAWPAYLAVYRSRHACPTCVLVVTPHADVAAWARRPIALGPGNELRVLVLGPESVPVVTDSAVARANPALAVLSALAHGDDVVHGERAAFVALSALGTFDGTTNATPQRKALAAAIMDRAGFPRFILSPVEQKLLDAILAKKDAEQRAAVAGKAEGELHGKLKVLLKILARTGVALTAEQRATLEACTDEARIDEWVDRAFTARSGEELLR